MAAYELWGPGDDTQLHPTEAGQVTGVSVRRRAELGFADQALVKAEDRSPTWPAGAIGSITHTGDFCLAVASRGDPREGSLGVDAERVGRVTDRLHRIVFTPSEREWLDSLSPPRRAEVATVIFSGKEAFYKAQFVQTGRWVGFGDVAVQPVGADLELVPASELAVLGRMRWPLAVRATLRDGFAVTAVGLGPLER